MALFAKLFAEILRDWTTDGVPASGANRPSKSDLRAWGAVVEGVLLSGATALLTTGGTANVQTATPSPALPAYTTGQIFVYLPSATNTLTATLNVSGLGPKAMVSRAGDALAGGEISAGCACVLLYDGTSFRLLTGMQNLFVSGVGGTANAITAATNPAVAGLAKGQVVYLVPAAANTGAVTLNLNGLGAKSIRTPAGALLQGGELNIGQLYELIYDGANLRLVSSPTLDGSTTYNPPSLTNGSGTTTTVSVPGAQVIDYAEASFSLDLQGITVTAWVSAVDTVSVRFQNASGGTLDLASGTLRVRVRRG